MGQRLVMHIMKEEKELACSYYHWSGFTSSTAEILTHIVESNLNLEKELNLSDLELAIFLLEETGAGLSHDSVCYISKHKLEVRKSLLNKPVIDRDTGIINVDPPGMRESNYWADANAYYDIKTGEISIAAFFIFSPDEFEDVYDMRFPELPTIKSRNEDDYNDFLYTFETVHDLNHFLTMLPCATEDGYVIAPIE